MTVAIGRIPEAEFWFRDIVYQRICLEEAPGMVVGVMLRETSIIYEVNWGGQTGEHYGYELSREYVPDFCREKTS